MHIRGYVIVLFGLTRDAKATRDAGVSESAESLRIGYDVHRREPTSLKSIPPRIWLLSNSSIAHQLSWLFLRSQKPRLFRSIKMTMSRQDESRIDVRF